MKKGFASTIGVALAVLSIALAVGALAAFSSLEQAGVASLELRKTGERLSDARAFYDNAVTDALLDSAFQSCGCDVNAPSSISSKVAVLVPAYLGNASSALSSPSLTVDASQLSIPSFSASSCNATLSGIFSYYANVSSFNAQNGAAVSGTKSLEIQKTSSSVLMVVYNSTTLVANVTIIC